MKHANLSIFIPHVGCPNDCIFCDQKSISGTKNAPSLKEIDDIIKTSVKEIDFTKTKAEIAFFGGSFTMINRDYMIDLLKVASKYVADDKFFGIRISTRPDGINKEILTILKKYMVTTIELGIQSFDDDVLLKNQRGYNSDKAIKSAKLIKEFGFNMSLQMMCGLIGDDEQKDILTAKKIVKLKADETRIYPTLVLKNTKLCKLYNNGDYKPLDLEKAVEISAKCYKIFIDNNVKILKIGLHSEKDFQNESIVAGPFHPSFGELVRSKVFLDEVLNKLKKDNYNEILICVPQNMMSLAIGNSKRNKIFLENRFNCKAIFKISDKIDIITK